MGEYDIAIIGSGPGGYVAALYAAGCGMKVAVIEKSELGGVCLNWGCIPTKALMASANFLNLVKRASEFGVSVGKCAADYSDIKKRKDEIVSRLKKGIEALFKAKKIDLKTGFGKLLDKNTVEVNGEKIRAKHIIIATGTDAAELPSFPYDKNRVLTSADMLDLEDLPKRLLIVGGGVNGCEFAYAFSSLGVDVTIVELMDRLLPMMDRELGKNMETILKRRGIEVETKTRLDSPPDEYDKIVVCIGRKHNTDGMGLEDLGIKTQKGSIVIDKNLRTSIPNIFAIGDVIGGYLLAHVASHEGIVACENIMGNPTEVDYSGVPLCIYTEPQIASAGLSQNEAQEKGHKVKTAKFPFKSLGKAHTISDTEGFLKIVGDEQTGELLGVHIVGPHASDLIGEACVIIKHRLKIKEIAEIMHAHPTLSEAFTEAGYLFGNKPLHVI